MRIDALESRLSGDATLSPSNKASSGLAIGSHAPSFELPHFSGNSILTLRRFGPQPDLDVNFDLFSDPDCGPCSALLPDIERWEQEYASLLMFVLISRGSPSLKQEKISRSGLKYMLLQRTREVAIAYDVAGTPSAVLVNVDGRIASFLASGAQAITSLVASSARTGVKEVFAGNRANGVPAAANTALSVDLPIGSPSPSIKLPDLADKIVDLADLKHQETLLLFWNPDCGFCTRMLPALKEWEERQSGPLLLIVSSGTIEKNRAMGLR